MGGAGGPTPPSIRFLSVPAPSEFDLAGIFKYTAVSCWLVAFCLALKTTRPRSPPRRNCLLMPVVPPLHATWPEAVLYFIIGAPLACLCALMLMGVWEMFKITYYGEDPDGPPSVSPRGR
ncbi:hypothetical protein C8R46DRAFT_1234384 [Mycena filopes]|nr:hypothetical protein C8R46DRAFT_1234384 [Mycena filopes]